MSENKKITVNEDELKHSAGASADERRRQILKGSLAVPPIAMSVMGKPAMGWSTMCGYSGQLSGNLSQPDEECGGEGCTPGYYKTHSDWHTALPPTMLYFDVFGIDIFPGMTLGEVIGFCGYPTQIPASLVNLSLLGSCHPNAACLKLAIRLGFHSVAALQNAALPTVSYDLTVSEVIQRTYDAFDSDDKATIEAQKDEFDIFNNQGCPLGGGGTNCKGNIEIDFDA